MEKKPSGNGSLDWEVSEEHWKQKKPESPKAAVEATPEPPSARATTAPASPRSTKSGPVGQSVMHMSTLRRAPKYTFRGVKDRFKTRGLQAASQVPGPGAYGKTAVAPEVLSSRHRKSPGYGFGTSAKQGDVEIRAPGPGTYPRASAGFVGRGGKAFSLTPRRWPGPPPDQGSHLLAPGPGAHDVDKSIRGPSYSISPRRAPDKGGAALVPGPSQYGMMDRALGQTKPKLPSWGFGTTKRPGNILQDDRPVPGVKGKSGASAWVSKLPGPGSYNTPSTVGEGPKFSVGARRKLSRQVLSPGPGDTGGPYTTFV